RRGVVLLRRQVRLAAAEQRPERAMSFLLLPVAADASVLLVAQMLRLALPGQGVHVTRRRLQRLGVLRQRPIVLLRRESRVGLCQRVPNLVGLAILVGLLP